MVIPTIDWLIFIASHVWNKFLIFTLFQRENIIVKILNSVFLYSILHLFLLSSARSEKISEDL